MTEAEQHQTKRLENLFDQTMPLIQEVLTLHTSLQRNVAAFLALRAELDTILDEEIQILTQHHLAAAKADSHQAISRVRWALLVLLVMGLLAGSSAAVAVSRGIIRPIGRLVEGAEHISRGVFAHRIEVTTQDELGQLAAAFNHMAATLQHEQEALLQSKAELEVRVTERTAELVQTNDQLQSELAEHQRAEEALRVSEERYRLLAENSADVIWTTDMNLQFTYVSPSITHLRGYSIEEAVAQTMQARLTPASYEIAQQVFTEELVQEKMGQGDLRRSRTLEVEVACKDGSTVWVEVKTTFLRDPHGRPVGILGVTRDIGERKRFEIQLRQMQKMEAIGTLAGGIAHDFNNILAAILGYTELSLGDMSPDSIGWSNLQEVLTAAKRARDLVQQILAFSRKSEQARSPVRISCIVKEVLTLLRASLPSTIEIRQQITDETAIILAESTQIHQVAMNLCANAAHTMRETGGVLEVCLEAVEVTADVTATHSELTPGPHLCLTVRDTGHGMTPEVMERIFEPFFTTKGVGEGTGMGLAVAHGIIASHGGAITVESTPGQGTTFTISLSRHHGVTTGEVSLPESVPGGNERVLFVDDEVPLARLGQAMLQRLGYDVVIHTSSIEALEAFREAPHRFDLVITDQTMPTMTGEVLVRELRRLRSDIPIILCTGFSYTMSAEKAQEMGIGAFLMKPLMTGDLGAAIRRALEQKHEHVT